MYSQRIFELTILAEAVTPSGTMEYSYSRRIKKFSTNQSKDVTHTWEISTSSSSGNSIIDIFEVVLTPQNLPNSTVVLVLDLSKVLTDTLTKTQPAGLVDNLLKWLEIIGKRVEECTKELRLKANPITQTLLDLMKKKANFITEDHPDKLVINFCNSQKFHEANWNPSCFSWQ